MQKIRKELPSFVVVGLTCRTSNALEQDPATAKIGPLVQKYFTASIGDTIPHRKNPGTTFSLYTDYDSDLNGEYTYFIGEEVTDFAELPGECVLLSIPAQQYVKFTMGPGIMPGVCVDGWQKIWAMSQEELGGKRRYVADFEVYDERARDPQKTELDIYIGLAE